MEVVVVTTGVARWAKIQSSLQTSPPSNQHQFLLHAGCPSCRQLTLSKHWRNINAVFSESILHINANISYHDVSSSSSFQRNLWFSLITSKSVLSRDLKYKQNQLSVTFQQHIYLCSNYIYLHSNYCIKQLEISSKSQLFQGGGGYFSKIWTSKFLWTLNCTKTMQYYNSNMISLKLPIQTSNHVNLSVTKVTL